jgi:hypothetical protein
MIENLPPRAFVIVGALAQTAGAQSADPSSCIPCLSVSLLNVRGGLFARQQFSVEILWKGIFFQSGQIELLRDGPRVNQHLETARRRAATGVSYVLQLPLDMNDPAHDWHPDLVKYWRKFGSEVGVNVPALRSPRGAEAVQVRAVKVRASIVSALQVRDLNIVLERTDDEPCDLIVATNVLVYYDAFEQALALTNVAKMLRPDGFLLTNYAVSPLPPMEPEASLVTPVFWDRQDNGDALFWYQRRRFAGLTERTEFTEQAFNTETRRHGILEAGGKPAQARDGIDQR